MHLYLIRHPKPEVAPGICYGSTDLRVSQEECDRVVADVSASLPRSIPVFSSPLQRCRRFAERLAATLGSTPVILDARLPEMHFGTWEMRSWSSIPREEVDAWTDDLITYRPGGGETVLELASRVYAFYQDVQQQADGHAVVVSHAGTMRFLRAFQTGLPLEEAALLAAKSGHGVAYGEMILLDC
jgi:alpha-ribazole phosphatase